MFDFETEITTLFLKICIIFQRTLQFLCERFSNNNSPVFTDEEVVTVYIIGIIEGRKNIKEIYFHAKRYWQDLFPMMPSYTAFNYRLNRLEDVFPILLEYYQDQLPKDIYDKFNHRVVDSMPIVMAKNNRRFKASVAPELADKSGYCAAKNLYYYGAKLHILASYKVGSMPVPEYIGLTHAGMNDGKAYEPLCYDQQVKQYMKFADKAYPPSQETNTYTPVKKEKGQAYLDAADQLYSTAVSKIRQPVESMNNWIQEKTGIEIASKVRSTKGLLVHVFGRLCAAFELLMQKYSA